MLFKFTLHYHVKKKLENISTVIRKPLAPKGKKHLLRTQETVDYISGRNRNVFI